MLLKSTGCFAALSQQVQMLICIPSNGATNKFVLMLISGAQAQIATAHGSVVSPGGGRRTSFQLTSECAGQSTALAGLAARPLKAAAAKPSRAGAPATLLYEMCWLADEPMLLAGRAQAGSPTRLWQVSSQADPQQASGRKPWFK